MSKCKICVISLLINMYVNEVLLKTKLKQKKNVHKMNDLTNRMCPCMLLYAAYGITFRTWLPDKLGFFLLLFWPNTLFHVEYHAIAEQMSEDKHIV